MLLVSCPARRISSPSQWDYGHVSTRRQIRRSLHGKRLGLSDDSLDLDSLDSFKRKLKFYLLNSCFNV